MKTDINGCSTCPPGEDHYEFYTFRGQEYIQYDYRHTNGELFSCVAKTLTEARARRDEWLSKFEKVKDTDIKDDGEIEPFQYGSMKVPIYNGL